MQEKRPVTNSRMFSSLMERRHERFGRTMLVTALAVPVLVAGGDFVIALRPFRRPGGDFGRLRIVTDPETSFEIDGDAYLGEEGLRVLSAAGPGTPTLTLGVMERQRRIFRAVEVFAAIAARRPALQTRTARRAMWICATNSTAKCSSR